MRSTESTSALVRWFPVLAERSIRIYMSGQMASVAGAWILDITLNLLTWRLSESPGTLGVVNFLLFVPAIVITPLLSPRLTQRNARNVTLIALVAGVATAAALAASMYFDLLALPLIFVFAALRGVFNGVEMPARHVLISSLVADPSRIGSAVAINSMVYQVARMLGPAFGAAIFGAAGAVWGFTAGAAGFAIMLACVAGLPAFPERVLEAAADQRPGMRVAITYVWRHSFGSVFLPVAVCVAVFAGAYQTLIPVLADRVYGNAQFWTGSFYGAAGGGALVGAVLLSSRYLLPLIRHIHVLTPWLVAGALCGLGMTRLSTIAMLLFFLLGLGITLASTGTNAILQQGVPAHLRGAVTGLYLSSYIGSIPLSQLLGGAIAQQLSVTQAFLVLSGGLALSLLAIFIPRWLRLRRLELDAEKL